MKKIVFSFLMAMLTTVFFCISSQAAWLSSEAPVLKYGSTGHYVTQLQQDLNTLGYGLDVDGSFGPATLAAVKDYQSQMGLEVDGSVGPATKSSIISTINSFESRTSIQIPGTSALTRGDTGIRVRFLQRTLYLLGYSVNVNSNFDDTTYEAVRSFQEDHGLTANGSCGPETIQCINNAILNAGSEVENNKWKWPVPLSANYISGEFAQYRSSTRRHAGIDISVPEGTNVYASRSGIIAAVVYNGGARGHYVVIDHGDKYYSVYQHLSTIQCNVGQSVQKGDTIARSGDSGSPNSYHLHFEVHRECPPGLRNSVFGDGSDKLGTHNLANPSPLIQWADTSNHGRDYYLDDIFIDRIKYDELPSNLHNAYSSGQWQQQYGYLNEPR